MKTHLQRPTGVPRMPYGIRLALLACAIEVGMGVAYTQTAQAQTYKVLYAFKGGSDGALPAASLLRDKSGNLYGTTRLDSGTGGCGTVFELDANGTETVLHGFSGPDGCNPQAGLVRDSSGNFYGTTVNGGPGGFGVVFKLDRSHNETVLYSFTGAGDGAYPYGGLVRDAAGNLYGTTEYGGHFSHYCFYGCGVVFRLRIGGKEIVLHAFTGNKSDGAYPLAGLLADAAGNLYGTTSGGGSYGGGTVFKIDKHGMETVLHDFGPDGDSPYGGLIRDAEGSLYGTTSVGGPLKYGTVFKLDNTGHETVLFNFDGYNGGESVAGLVRDMAGNLYGTTLKGGDTNWGTIFELDKAGHETILHSFTYYEGGSDAALIRDSSGNLYGTTGNCTNCNLGTVFRLNP